MYTILQTGAAWLTPAPEPPLFEPQREDPQKSLDALPPRHEAYLAEAQRLQAEYASSIHILVGFEAEFIRADFGPHVRALAAAPCVDYFIGSVHHVHGLPIDYDAPTYAAAVAAARGSEERLFEDYYDLQHEMLMALEPRVVGHFDLIRLLSERPGRDVRQWEGVWAKIKRNLELVARQGGLLECNTAALRKGLDEPYPCRAIAEVGAPRMVKGRTCADSAQEWLKMGGKFTMSDDSHGIAHIATNYARGIAYLESLGVEHVWTFRRRPPLGVESPTKKATLEEAAVSLKEFRKHFS